jgi:hypothetical protein
VCTSAGVVFESDPVWYCSTMDALGMYIIRKHYCVLYFLRHNHLVSCTIAVAVFLKQMQNLMAQHYIFNAIWLLWVHFNKSVSHFIIRNNTFVF